MLDRSGRVRVIAVAVLALGVMGAVVASALVARAKSPAEEPGTELARRDANHPYGRTEPDKRPEALPGCEPDPKAPPVARFELERDVLDLGSVRQGVQIVREVVLRNAGTGPLCVDEPVTGCGCVQAKFLGEKRIAPGGSATIRITVDTTAREGKQEKDVRMLTNDPARKEARFVVKADIRLGIVLVAQGTGMYFGRHAPGKPGELVVRLKSPKSDPPWSVTGVEGKKTAFTFEAKDVEPGDEEFRHVEVTLRHPGAMEMTLHNEDVKIKTSNPDRPEIVVRTQLLVVDKYYTGPKALSFGYVGPKTPARPRSVQVSAGEITQDFRVTAAKVEGKGFEAGAPRRLAEGWGIEVNYDGASRKAGTIEATLVITIDDPDLPELRVPIRATVVD